jgi:hypothetical protein
MSSKLIEEYKRQRDELRRRFQDTKTGDQTLFIDQTKLFKPLIESSKAIEDKIASNQDDLSNALIPFTRELQKRNEHVATLQNLPYPTGIEDVPQSTPQKTQTVYIDLNGKLLNQTHRENLQDLGLDLPSEVQVKGTYEEAYDKAKTESKRIGQFLGKSSKKDAKEKAVYESQKQTIKLYKAKLRGLMGAKQFVKTSGEGLPPVSRPATIVKRKRGRGRPRKYHDIIIYQNPHELCVKLHENVTAKEAGNTGLDNIITSILDELLTIKYINKDEYDSLFKTIFHII